MEKPPQTPAAVSDMTPQEVVISKFFEAVVAMQTACSQVDMTKAQFRDHTGRIYSAAAVMRLIDRHMNFIRHRLGAEYIPSRDRRDLNPTTNPRR